MRKIVLVMGEELEGAPFLYALGLARQLKELNYYTEIIGIDYSINHCRSNVVDGVTCITMSGENYAPYNRKTYKQNMRKASNDIVTYLKNKEVDDIILFSGHIDWMEKICAWAEKNAVITHIVALEYPSIDLSDFSSLRSFISWRTIYKDRIYTLKKAIKYKKAICISKHFVSFLTRKGVKCLYLPHILEISKNVVKQKNEQLNLVYCGYPGRKCSKDRLDIMVKGIIKSVEEGMNPILHIFGLTESDFIDLHIVDNDTIKQMNTTNIVFHGKVNPELLLSEYEKMDFSVLVRDVKKKTQFGYPTKAAQSLALGTPIIGNITSDLGDVIIDNETGVIMKEVSVPEFVNCIKRAYDIRKDSCFLVNNSVEMAKKTYGLNARKDDFVAYFE